MNCIGTLEMVSDNNTSCRIMTFRPVRIMIVGIEVSFPASASTTHKLEMSLAQRKSLIQKISCGAWRIKKSYARDVRDVVLGDAGALEWPLVQSTSYSSLGMMLVCRDAANGNSNTIAASLPEYNPH